MPEQSWAERIPAAIAMAEGKLGHVTIGDFSGQGEFYHRGGGLGAITAGEVALAKALWEELDPGDFQVDSDRVPALRAFVEKVEAMT